MPGMALLLRPWSNRLIFITPLAPEGTVAGEKALAGSFTPPVTRAGLAGSKEVHVMGAVAVPESRSSSSSGSVRWWRS